MAIQFYDPGAAAVRTMATALSERGVYRLETPVLRFNGQGLPVTAARRRATWTWTTISASEYEWLVTTLLAGDEARRFTSVGGGNVTKIWNNKSAEVQANSLIVHVPTYEGKTGARYSNVQIVFSNILLA